LIRVVVLDVTESVSGRIPGQRRPNSGLLSPVAHIHSYNGRRDGDPNWQKYDEAWEKAEALQERVIAYLEQVAAEEGFTVCNADVIDASAGSAQVWVRHGRCALPGKLTQCGQRGESGKSLLTGPTRLCILHTLSG
jgi:hypothetical protein